MRKSQSSTYQHIYTVTLVILSRHGAPVRKGQTMSYAVTSTSVEIMRTCVVRVCECKPNNAYANSACERKRKIFPREAITLEASAMLKLPMWQNYLRCHKTSVFTPIILHVHACVNYSYISWAPPRLLGGPLATRLHPLG